MSRELRIFVPRWMDAANTNAQNLNARALLSRFTSKDALWNATYYNEPDPATTEAARVKANKLWRTRLWHWHMFLMYQGEWDAIFYPGMEWFDDRGLRIRKAGRRVPVIGVLEGLAGDERREKELASVAGHPVFCHRISKESVERCDRVLTACDHILAITPMLARLGKALYGDKISVLPLGIETSIFRPLKTPKNENFRVIGAGNLKPNKRPEVFLGLAKRFPHAEFVWFGEGPLLESMRKAAVRSGMENVSFTGRALPGQLAQEYNRSHLFVLPSHSEGAPKVLQESAACGLPRIAFGHYEPSIQNGVDGYAVWSDEELFARVGELIDNNNAAHEMGLCAAQVAASQDWNLIAPKWEEEILTHVRRLL